MIDQLRGTGEVFTGYKFGRVAFLTVLSQGTFFWVQGICASPWLKDVLQLVPEAVVTMLFWIAVAMVAGFIGIDSLAGRLQRFGIPVRTAAIRAMTFF